jgi:pimeloyl-ACP methyl ester carboxylesterase
VIAHTLKGRRAYASTAYPFDEAKLGALIGAGYDRSYYPQGTLRHWAAIMTAPPRTDRLKTLRVPSLILHGTADTLIPCEAGRHTAACIPGAEYHELEGWGHDIPLGVIPALFDRMLPFIGRVEAMREDGFAQPVAPGCCG